ncbi:MAG: hypothetical protein MUF22_04055 [Chitinispirillaceae bacterium]|nr:hypothetical protein [Chitinispirillaceae bacterium]
MAITKADVLIWLKLADEKKIPSDPDVLELGEGEWYGDYSVRKLPEFIDKYAKDSDKESLNRWYKDMATDPRPWPEKRHICFDLVKLFYKTVLQFRNVTSIDLHGTANALKLDLNYSLNASKQYDVIINTGTIEHVFNAGQAFISCHNLCKEQGLMFHVFPLINQHVA